MEGDVTPCFADDAAWEKEQRVETSMALRLRGEDIAGALTDEGICGTVDEKTLASM